jgi:hypothetical protein
MNSYLRSQRAYDLLDRIGSSYPYRQSWSDLIGNMNPWNSLLYHITSVQSYSSANILEYSHA